MVETRVLSSDVERLVVAAVINHDGAPIWVCLRFETRQHLVEPGRSVANRHYDANQGGTLLSQQSGPWTGASWSSTRSFGSPERAGRRQGQRTTTCNRMGSLGNALPSSEVTRYPIGASCLSKKSKS